MADLTVHRYDYAMPEALGDFNVEDYIAGALEWIDGLVGPKEKVALSASGGVDSTTVGFLLQEVLGDRLYPFFIDDGLRRIIGGREEAEVTAEMFDDFPNFQVIRTRDAVAIQRSGPYPFRIAVVGPHGNVEIGVVERQPYFGHFRGRGSGVRFVLNHGQGGNGIPGQLIYLAVEPDVLNTRYGQGRIALGTQKGEWEACQEY